MGSETSKIFI